MLGLGKPKQQKRHMVAKPVAKQSTKAVIKQNVRPLVTEVKAEKVKQAKQGLNPYRQFIEHNADATVEDLTKYFEMKVKTSGPDASSTIKVAAGLSLLALIAAAYYPILEQMSNINSMLLGYGITGSFAAAAIASILFMGKQLKPMPSKELNMHFRMYLQAKNQMQARNKVEPVAEAPVTPEIETPIEEAAAEDIETQTAEAS